MYTGATFSSCGLYRYKLWRIWDDLQPYCMFLMLNPSTADENKNDPTVERCQRYATKWGYGGLHVCNIFAYRSTDPKGLLIPKDPVGPKNNEAIFDVASEAGIVVCAWGNHGLLNNRSDQIRKLLANKKLHCLKINKSTGQPGHPLYLKKDLTPQEY